MMRWLLGAARNWGWALALLVAIGALAFGGWVFNPVQEGVDEGITQFAAAGPEYPPDLVDHGGRGPDEVRGELVGAATNIVYPRPSSFLADRGIQYNFYGSPNWSGRGLNVLDGIVVHVTGPGTCPGMRSWFNNPAANASAHFGVCKDGSIEQYVDLQYGAWHAGVVNKPDTSNGYIMSMVNSGINPNSRTVGIELLLAPGELLNDYPEMKKSFYALMNWLHEAADIPYSRDRIIGHYQIDSVNRSVDPRCCVDLDKTVAELAGGVVNPPAPPTGTVDLWPPPSYLPECWTDAIDPTWSGRYNLCGPAWVGANGHFYVVNVGWFYPNGVAIQ